MPASELFECPSYVMCACGICVCVCCRLKGVIELVDMFETVSSDLEVWLSDALQTLDTVNSSLQTVPPDADQLTDAAVSLKVCCYTCSCSFTVWEVSLEP